MTSKLLFSFTSSCSFFSQAAASLKNIFTRFHTLGTAKELLHFSCIHNIIYKIFFFCSAHVSLHFRFFTILYIFFFQYYYAFLWISYDDRCCIFLVVCNDEYSLWMWWWKTEGKIQIVAIFFIFIIFKHEYQQYSQKGNFLLSSYAFLLFIVVWYWCIVYMLNNSVA